MSSRWVEKLEARLRTLVSNPNNLLRAPMQHALLAGGKRLRPKLFNAALIMFGLDIEDYLDVACALEMVHTYSLVHDDLPAMDDDAYRRGQPTVHVAYDEATAILSGDALLTDAFTVLANAPNLSAERRINLVRILAEKAGSSGMVAGQVLDLKATKQTIDVTALNTMHALKTAALFEAALMMGGVVSGVTNLHQLEQCGRALGLAFQIQDDLLDVESTQEAMGKSLSDASHEKASYVRIMGLSDAKEACRATFEKARTLCAALGTDAEPLHTLIDTIEQRNR